MDDKGKVRQLNNEIDKLKEICKCTLYKNVKKKLMSMNSTVIKPGLYMIK
jgi:hypothetical protein